ncbi:MAG: hypothetical protein E6I94_05240 [Chloroflexi bacterium]|nr:MAG: hypothetical protein E6I94_05240 [Chloroflexota bacterium]
MEFYPWVVLIHVLAAFAFVLAHGASAFVAFRVRAEREPARIAALLDLSSSTLAVMYVALLVLLIAGIVAGIMGSWFAKLWTWAAIGVLVAVLVLMYVLASTYYTGVRRALGQATFGSKEPPPPPVSVDELLAMLDSRRPEAITLVGGIGLVVLVWLMILKPF